MTMRVIDSHTAGEPTRTAIAGFPPLGMGSLRERARVFATAFDDLRNAIVCEPRGSDPVVGALLVEPDEGEADVGVVFFNNVGLLGMCGHGTIGVVATLAHLGRLKAGALRVQTVAGVVQAELGKDGSVVVANVESHRSQSGVRVALGDGRVVSGDIAYGGNWFYLCADHGLEVSRANLDQLLRRAEEIRGALARAGVKGDSGEPIDHVELLAAAVAPENHGRAFVLCPGGAYDRSPCGTGTSAKLACLAADGGLAPGAIWRQESVIGSVFEGWYERPLAGARGVMPFIRGSAFVTADATLILDPRDPFVHGIR
ncbi:MAG: proline racemase family protein [Phycisphaerales bacterium]